MARRQPSAAACQGRSQRCAVASIKAVASEGENGGGDRPWSDAPPHQPVGLVSGVVVRSPTLQMPAWLMRPRQVGRRRDIGADRRDVRRNLRRPRKLCSNLIYSVFDRDQRDRENCRLHLRFAPRAPVAQRHSSGCALRWADFRCLALPLMVGSRVAKSVGVVA